MFDGCQRRLGFLRVPVLVAFIYAPIRCYKCRQYLYGWIFKLWPTSLCFGVHFLVATRQNEKKYTEKKTFTQYKFVKLIWCLSFQVSQLSRLAACVRWNHATDATIIPTHYGQPHLMVGQLLAVEYIHKTQNDQLPALPFALFPWCKKCLHSSEKGS